MINEFRVLKRTAVLRWTFHNAEKFSRKPLPKINNHKNVKYLMKYLSNPKIFNNIWYSFPRVVDVSLYLRLLKPEEGVY
jgi:hypothetical protein